MVVYQSDDGTVPLFSIPRSSIAENPFTSLLLCSCSSPSSSAVVGSAILWCQHLAIEVMWLIIFLSYLKFNYLFLYFLYSYAYYSFFSYMSMKIMYFERNSNWIFMFSGLHRLHMATYGLPFHCCCSCNQCMLAKFVFLLKCSRTRLGNKKNYFTIFVSNHWGCG